MAIGTLVNKNYLKAGISNPLVAAVRQVMTKNNQSLEATKLDLSDYLKDEDDIAEYTSQVLTEGDREELLRAIGYVAKARGMTQLAKPYGYLNKR